MQTHSPTIDASLRTRIAYLIHETLTDASKLSEVWTKFNLLRDPQATGRNCISLQCFRAWLLNIGHGRFPLDYLPTLCEAMRQSHVDPAPLVNMLTNLCLPLPEETVDGSVTDEFIKMSMKMGELAQHIEADDQTNSQIRLFMIDVSRMQLLCRAMFAELNQRLIS